MIQCAADCCIASYFVIMKLHGSYPQSFLAAIKYPLSILYISTSCSGVPSFMDTIVLQIVALSSIDDPIAATSDCVALPANWHFQILWNPSARSNFT